MAKELIEYLKMKVYKIRNSALKMIFLENINRNKGGKISNG